MSQISFLKLVPGDELIVILNLVVTYLFFCFDFHDFLKVLYFE